MHVGIPSKGRAGSKLKSIDFLKSATIYVPESEYKQYKSIYGSRVCGVPNDVNGITKTRNFILNQANDPYVVMVDDDLKCCGFINILEKSVKRIVINDEVVFYKEMQKIADLTHDMGGSLFGLSTMSDPAGIYGYKPFVFRTYVLGSCIGHINNGKYLYDESFSVKEDYEITLRHIKNEGFVVGARYMFFECSHQHDEGGCREYRTQKNELEAIQKLTRMYPGMIREIKRKGTEYSIQLEF